MAGRYLVTGVQLGLLQATPDEQARKKLVNTIIDKQFVGDTNNTDVVKDAKRIEELF